MKDQILETPTDDQDDTPNDSVDFEVEEVEVPAEAVAVHRT
ncbi:MAG TPA: hypothetical protein VGE28_19830 [Pseudomonas sp.]